MDEFIYQYINLYYSILEIEPLPEGSLKIKVVDDIDFFNIAKRIHETDLSQIQNYPMFWHQNKKGGYTLVVKENVLNENVDERYGVECLYTNLTEIYYTSNGSFPSMEANAHNTFIHKQVATGFAVWKEFYCTYIANSALMNLYASVGKEGYDIKSQRKNAKQLVNQIFTVRDAEEDVKMSTILYAMSKMASTEDNKDMCMDFSKMLPVIDCSTSIQNLYRTLYSSVPDELTKGTLNYIGRMYSKIKKSISEGNN